MTGLRDLPPELKIAVVAALRDDETHDHKQADIKVASLAALSATDRCFHQLVNPILYQFGVLRHPYLLCWATEIGDLNVMRKILETGAIDSQTGIIRYNPRREYVPWDPKSMSAGERFRSFYKRDGRKFQRRLDFYTTLVINDPVLRRSSSPPLGDDLSSEEHLSETAGLFMDDYDGFDDIDDSSSEQFSEDASVDDHFSAGEGSGGAEDSDDVVSLDGSGYHAGYGGNGGYNLDNGDSISSSQPSLDDEALREELEEMQRESLGIIRYPDLDDYDDADEHDIKAMYWFPVHIASRSGNLAALQLLIAFGALLNISSKGFCCKDDQMALYWDGWDERSPAWSPFHVALCHGHTELAKYMIKRCPHIQERFRIYDEPSWSVLPVFISAMRHGYPDLAELSLEEGIDDVHDSDPDLFGATLLWRAFWETENFQEALPILLRYGADIDRDLGQGHTLLVEACLYGRFREALALVNAGADATVVLRSPCPGSSLDLAWEGVGQSLPVPVQGCGVLDICCGMPNALYSGAAARVRVPETLIPPSLESFPDMIRRLVDSDAWRISLAKQRPLHIAAATQNSRALKILLDSGMDPTSLDEEGVNVLSHASKWQAGAYASLQEFSETLFVLVERLRNYGGKGTTASSVATSGLDKPRVIDGNNALRNLLEDVFLENDFDSRLARNNAALELVAAGFADINTRDKFGRTFLMVVAAEGEDRVVPKLMKYGAKLEHNREIDDLAAIWVDFVMSDNGRHEGGIGAAYRLVCTLDVAKRITGDPQFFAFAMYGRRYDVVTLMVDDLEAANLTLTGGEAWRELKVKMEETAEVRQCRFYWSRFCGQQLPCDGSSLVQIAVEFGFSFVVKKLIKERGVDANQLDPDGQSLFHIVVRTMDHGSVKMVRLLRKLGADINATDNNGDTPLSLFCKEMLRLYEYHHDIYGHDVLLIRDLFSTLVMCGSSPSARNNKGQRVLDLIERIRTHDGAVCGLRKHIRRNLLYHVMLYRKSIGM